MGGLKGKIKVTFTTMMIGTVAIAGIPPLAGFVSKDEILAHAYAHSPIFWGVGVLTAMLTSFYMFRMMYLTFYGKFRGTHEQEHHLHESPPTMTIPLIVLAILSIVGGFIGWPEVLGGHHELEHFLAPVFKASNEILGEHHMTASLEYALMGVSVTVAFAAMIWAYVKYAKNGSVPVADTEERPALTSISYHKFYLDELYDLIIRKPLDWLSTFFYNIVERLGIDGLVNGIGKGTIETSKGLRLLQTGNVGFYIFIMVLGIIAVLLYSVFGLTKI